MWENVDWCSLTEIDEPWRQKGWKKKAWAETRRIILWHRNMVFLFTTFYAVKWMRACTLYTVRVSVNNWIWIAWPTKCACILLILKTHWHNQQSQCVAISYSYDTQRHLLRCKKILSEMFDAHTLSSREREKKEWKTQPSTSKTWNHSSYFLQCLRWYLSRWFMVDSTEWQFAASSLVFYCSLFVLLVALNALLFGPALSTIFCFAHCFQ